MKDGLSADETSTALKTAWEILRALNFRDFGAIRTLRSADFPEHISLACRPAAGLALETIAWLEYAPKKHSIDRAAQMLVRAVALTPDDPMTTEKLAVIAKSMRPEDIRAFNDNPRKKAETEIGFTRAASRALESILTERYGITIEALRERNGSLLQAAVNNLSTDERAYVSRSLGHLGTLLCKEGCFFANGGVLSDAIAVASSLLQSLRLPRDITETREAIQQSLEAGTALEDLGEEIHLACDALETASAAYHLKGELFNNGGARKKSVSIDNLLDALDALRDSQGSNGILP